MALKSALKMNRHNQTKFNITRSRVKAAVH